MTVAMKKPSQKQIRDEIARLTVSEQARVIQLARQVWQYIGFDCLTATQENTKPARDWMKKCEVVEVVLDAGRYDEEIETALKRERTNTKPDPMKIEELEHIKAQFNWKTGMSYQAQNVLVGRAFMDREGF